MKDIALIQPNSPFLIDERVMPNIGLVRVATTLKNKGYSVDLHDFSGRNPEDIRRIAKDYKTFGFSSTTPQFPYVMNLFNILKQENPDAKTILGGAHASALYHLRQKGIKDINIDDLKVFNTIFAGEGEETSNMFKFGWQKAALIKDLDSVSIPDRDFVDMKSYHYDLFGKPTTSIQTQRGCPMKCIFCSGRDIEMYNKMRTHSPQRVLKELDELHDKYGFSSFMFYDDEVNLDNNRLEKLCETLSTRDYQYRGFVRSNGIVKHPESAMWMKNAGFVKLCSGVESGSDKILKTIKKGTTSKMNSKAREIIGNAGIHYEAFTLLGHPGEDLNDVSLTYNWLIDNKPDDFDINLITPYPGCKIYDDAIQSKKFKNYEWEYKGMYFNKPRYSEEDSFYKGHNAQSHSDVRTDALTNSVLKMFRNEIDTELKK